MDERWAGTKRTKFATQLEGIGIHDDGSIRRFNMRRWRIGRIEFSMPMFTLEYHRYAEEVERATREAAAGTRDITFREPVRAGGRRDPIAAG